MIGMRTRAEKAALEILGDAFFKALRMNGKALPEILKIAAVKAFVEDRVDEHAKNLRQGIIELNDTGVLTDEPEGGADDREE